MRDRISRRQFLQVSALGLMSQAFAPFFIADEKKESAFGRVAGSAVFVYASPDFQSEKITQLPKDSLLNLYDEVQSEKGINRIWYRVWQGFVHSAYIQKVDFQINPISPFLPEGGCVARVTVPYTQAMRYTSAAGWEPAYRLYFGTNHWLKDVFQGPDGKTWYAIEDSYQRIYYAPAENFHLFSPEEICPIAVDVPSKEKRIQVFISQQSIRALEGDRVVFDSLISSGVPQIGEVKAGEVPTETPIGDFHITVKTACRHMGGTEMTSDLNTSALPGIPWVSFFHEDGYSFHGTYWHNNFGLRMSHGCVNMRTEEALWLYRWTDPVIPFGERSISDWGTLVQIFE